uniref:Uncharacterized protein n=1 Tax=Rhizophagus irregularis (strain DAOM 181602 / DAOM 197198 / MUCL 43194) TaxID=747089 RepID=U9UGA2_RHIID
MLKTKKNVHNNRNQKEVSIHSSPKTPPNRVYTGLDKVENKIRERNPMELPVEKVAKLIHSSNMDLIVIITELVIAYGPYGGVFGTPTDYGYVFHHITNTN